MSDIVGGDDSDTYKLPWLFPHCEQKCPWRRAWGQPIVLWWWKARNEASQYHFGSGRQEKMSHLWSQGQRGMRRATVCPDLLAPRSRYLTPWLYRLFWGCWDCFEHWCLVCVLMNAFISFKSVWRWIIERNLYSEVCMSWEVVMLSIPQHIDYNGGGVVDRSFQEIKHIKQIEMSFMREFLVPRDHNRIANIFPEPYVNTYKRIYLASHFLGFFHARIRLARSI